MFKVTRNDISPALSRTIKGVRPPGRKRVLRAMGTTFKSITEGTFNSAGSAYRPKEWAPKKDGSPSILQKTTTMAKSFALEVTDDAAVVSNPTKYAATHQFGRPQGKGEIPARPFYPVVDGKLTPKAEEKIAAAARRVLESIAAGK
jgi:phage virion morphogenesis protein